MKQGIAWFMIIILVMGCAGKSAINPISEEDRIPLDINVQVRIAEVDNLGNTYVVDAKNRLIRYDKGFKELYRYANNKNGMISTIDVTNPLRIVVFYNDFNQVKIFDNTLSIIREFDFTQQYLDITACSVTNDGNLWVYDAVRLRLVKVDDNGNIILQSNNVTDFGMAGMYITKILENGNYVVLCDYDKGFWFFDNFGQYIYHFPVQGLRSFQFDGKMIVYYTDSGLKTFSIQQKERQIIGISSIKVTDDLKYILYNDGYYYGIYNQGVTKKRVDE